MSHFSDSWFPQRAKTQEQYQKFLALKAQFKAAGVEVSKTSVANSGAIINGIGTGESVVRPGLMMYGATSPGGSKRWQGKIISSLWAKVLDVRPIAQGQAVGYASTPAPWAGQLCVLGLGYGHGLSNQYQRLPLAVGDVSGEVVGEVNMDMLQALFPSAWPVQRGDLVPIWQHDLGQFMAVSAHTGLSPYEITCLLTSRISRCYGEW